MSESTPESTRQTLNRLYDNPEDRLTSLTELTADDTEIQTTQAVFKALSNEYRIQILEALRDGELCACEIQVVLDAPQSTVASHLRELKDTDLVNTRRQGNGHIIASEIQPSSNYSTLQTHLVGRQHDSFWYRDGTD